MADEDISLNEDQLLDSLDDGNNGDSEFLNEVKFVFSFKNRIFFILLWFRKCILQKRKIPKKKFIDGPQKRKKKQNGDDKYKRIQTIINAVLQTCIYVDRTKTFVKFPNEWIFFGNKIKMN